MKFTMLLATTNATPKLVEVETATQAQEIFVKWRGNRRSSGLRWDCGMIFAGSKQVASVSYNGRIWDTQDRTGKNYKSILPLR